MVRPAPAQPPRFHRLHPDDPRGIGPYTLIGRVGAGGMGTVYAGRSRDGGLVSVKVIHPELATDIEFRDRFAREVVIASRVDSPRVPTVLGSDLKADPPWLATEFVPGADLGRLVRRQGPLPTALLLGLAAGVASALGTMHNAGLIHRDLKPANVMVSPGGPSVLDLGIARALDETALTRSGGLVGTPGWIAPELYEGTDPGPAADMFGWGCLVAYAANGAPPFGEGPGDAMAYRVARTAPDLRGLPQELRPLVERALSPAPEHRPSAEEAVTELVGREPVEALLARTWAGVSAPVPEPALPRRTGRRRRRRTALAVASVASVLTLGLVTGLLWRSPDVSEPEHTAQGNDEQPQARSWDPPEAVTTGVDGDVATEVSFSNEHYGFNRSEERNGVAATMRNVSRTEPSGVEFDISGSGMPATNARFVSGSFVVLTPDGEFEETDVQPPLEEFDHDTYEVTLTFSEAPARGLLVFDPARGAHETDAGGGQPVGLCYDAEDGEFSLDFDTCLAEIAADSAQET